MGFLGPEKSVIKELGIDCDPRSNMKTPADKYNTSMPKVYAAGDCRYLFYIVSLLAGSERINVEKGKPCRFLLCLFKMCLNHVKELYLLVYIHTEQEIVANCNVSVQ